MKKLFLLILTTFAVSFSAFAKDYDVTITRIIDGDTAVGQVGLGFNVYIHNSIRLYGVDTPEVHSTNPLEKKAGLLIKAWLEKKVASAVASNKKIILTTLKKDVGSRGRPMGILIIGDEDICATLLELKFAHVFYAKKAKPPWTDSELKYIIDTLEPQPIKEKTISNAPSVPSIRTILAGQVSFSLPQSASTMMK